MLNKGVNKEPAARLYNTSRFFLARGLNFESRENRHENENKSRKIKKNGATLGPVSFFLIVFLLSYLFFDDTPDFQI